MYIKKIPSLVPFLSFECFELLSAFRGETFCAADCGCAFTVKALNTAIRPQAKLSVLSGTTHLRHLHSLKRGEQSQTLHLRRESGRRISLSTYQVWTRVFFFFLRYTHFVLIVPIHDQNLLGHTKMHIWV